MPDNTTHRLTMGTAALLVWRWIWPELELRMGIMSEALAGRPAVAQ